MRQVTRPCTEQTKLAKAPACCEFNALPAAPRALLDWRRTCGSNQVASVALSVSEPPDWIDRHRGCANAHREVVRQVRSFVLLSTA